MGALYFSCIKGIFNDFTIENVFDVFKLRLGYGEVGNVNGLGDYNFLTRYVKNNQGLYDLEHNFIQHIDLNLLIKI